MKRKRMRASEQEVLDAQCFFPLFFFYIRIYQNRGGGERQKEERAMEIERNLSPSKKKSR